MKGSLVLMIIVAAAVFLRTRDKVIAVDGVADISTTEDVESFRHNAGLPNNTFEMYEKQVRISTNMEFDGKRESHEVTKTNLPNADRGEYDRITLTPGDGELGTIKEDDAVYFKSLNKLVTTSSEHEIQLVDGTWDGYRSGQDVKFVSTPRGIEQIKTNLANLTKSVLADASKIAATRKLEAMGVKLTAITGNIENAQISNDPVTANLNTVKIHDTGLTRIVFKCHAEGTKGSN